MFLPRRRFLDFFAACGAALTAADWHEVAEGSEGFAAPS